MAATSGTWDEGWRTGRKWDEGVENCDEPGAGWRRGAGRRLSCGGAPACPIEGDGEDGLVFSFLCSFFFLQEVRAWQAPWKFSVSPSKKQGSSAMTFSNFDGHGRGESAEIRVHLQSSTPCSPTILPCSCLSCIVICSTSMPCFLWYISTKEAELLAFIVDSKQRKGQIC
jgi:hypothetical protein